MTPLELLLTLLQVVMVGVVGWVVADFLVPRVFPDAHLGLPERALLSLAGFAVFSVAMMLLHIASGGFAFRSEIAVLLAAVVLVAHHLQSEGVWPSEIPWRKVGAAAGVLTALYVIPVFLAGSSIREGDPPWHLGWTNEILGGRMLPDGPAPEFAENAYPWGWHSLLATTARLVPGSSALTAHEAWHVLLVIAIPLAAACLARRLNGDAGWAGAGAAALIGGWGWISAKGVDFVATPLNARHGADMVVASPNSAYELFPPALPREMGLVLLAAFGLVLIEALRTGRTRTAVAAGCLGGVVGLVSLPMFNAALLWTVIASVVLRGVRSFRPSAIVVGTAVGVAALWGANVVLAATRYGGFRDVTPVLGVEWPIGLALASWGLLLPLCVAGLFWSRAGRTLDGRAVTAFAVAATLLLALAVARREVGWTLGGNETLLHQGRMWPVAHLLAAAFAGVAIVKLAGLADGWGRGLGAALTAAVFLVGSVSLALSTLKIRELIAERVKGFEYADEDIDAGSFAREAAAELDPDDVVLVRGNNDLAFKLWEFSGASLARYDDPRIEGNELRIRYEDLARKYEAALKRGSFTPTHVVTPGKPRGRGEILAEGEFQGRNWYLQER